MIATDLAAALRIGFVVASAPAFGAVLLLAIARLTGADWSALRPWARLAWLAAPATLLLGLAQVAAAPPAHLGLWMHPLFVTARGVLAAGALGWAGQRLADGAGPTFAGVTLALYAALVTPVGSDWLLGGVPGHPVSAIGMMLFVQQVAAGCALALLASGGDERMRDDLAKLMIAAALALAYLAYMDYLIVWFGNLPEHVGFYVARSTPGQAALVWLVLLIGLVAPVALLAPRRVAVRQRAAGVCVLAGLLLFENWWIGGGILGLLAGATLAILPAAVARRVWARKRALG